MDSDLIKRFQDEMEIKDRWYHLRKYPQCFTGTQAVSWLCSNGPGATPEQPLSEVDALKLGEAWRQAGVFQHVTGEHAFKNEELFYRLTLSGDSASYQGTAKEAAASNQALNYMFSTFGSSSTSDNGSAKGAIEYTVPGFSHLHDYGEDSACLVVEDKVKPADNEHNLTLLSNAWPSNHVEPTPEGTYNMVAIGAGAAGLVTTYGAKGVGAKVAIIEKHLFGGDCLNFGCVPSKALLKAARSIEDIRCAGSEFGVSVGEVKVDFEAIMERMRRLRAKIAPNDSVAKLRAAGVDVYQGEASFASKNEIRVNGKILKFHRACIATGSRSAVPSIPGLRDSGFLTHVDIFNLSSMPTSMGIIGSGAIGCEMAYAFAIFGCKVTIFTRSPHILGNEDTDAVAIIESKFESLGIDIVRMVQYEKVEKDADGNKVLSVSVNGDKQCFTFEEILVSAGRVPNIEGMNLDIAGVKFDARKGVLVNDQLQTSNPNIYACGDICLPYKFTHAADASARLVVRNALFFGTGSWKDLVIPYSIYTGPEIARVGESEAELINRGIKPIIFRANLDDNDRAILDGEEHGFVKVMTQEGSDKVLGATIVSSHAGDLISYFSLCMRLDIGLSQLSTAVFPYPTQAESVRRVGDFFNRTKLTPLVKTVFDNLMALRRS